MDEQEEENKFPASVFKINLPVFQAWWTAQYLQSLWTLFALLAICGEPKSQYWQQEQNQKENQLQQPKKNQVQQPSLAKGE